MKNLSYLSISSSVQNEIGNVPLALYIGLVEARFIAIAANKKSLPYPDFHRKESLSLAQV
tara:strand:- start:642 stop:821 length:180 start_codon:yes stop_codon:yes gene_type:complete